MFSDVQIPFGKHAGKPLHTVPIAYLRWFAESCDNASPWLVMSVRSYLDQLEDDRLPPVPPSAVRTVYALVEAWFYTEAGQPGTPFCEELRASRHRLLAKLAATFGEDCPPFATAPMPDRRAARLDPGHGLQGPHQQQGSEVPR